MIPAYRCHTYSIISYSCPDFKSFLPSDVITSPAQHRPEPIGVILHPGGQKGRCQKRKLCKAQPLRQADIWQIEKQQCFVVGRIRQIHQQQCRKNQNRRSDADAAEEHLFGGFDAFRPPFSPKKRTDGQRHKQQQEADTLQNLLHQCFPAALMGSLIESIPKNERQQHTCQKNRHQNAHSRPDQRHDGAEPELYIFEVFAKFHCIPPFRCVYYTAFSNKRKEVCKKSCFLACDISFDMV